MGIVSAHTPTCTLATAMNTGLICPATIQSKPLKVRAKEKMFLKTRRQVKPSIDISPIESINQPNIYNDLKSKTG